MLTSAVFLWLNTTLDLAYKVEELLEDSGLLAKVCFLVTASAANMRGMGNILRWEHGAYNMLARFHELRIPL